MKKSAVILAVVALTAVTASAAIIEDWQMNDAADTPLKSLENSAGSALWNVDRPEIVPTGSGDLRFTQGSNLYNGAALTPTATGLYELSFKYSAATIAGGDISGATVGFALRDGVALNDLVIVRILRQNDKLLLQTRIGTSNTTYYDFGATSLPDTVTVRAVADLDTDLMDLYYAIGSGSETLVSDIAINDGTLDQLRMIAVLNDVDFGATDFVEVDYVTLAQIPEPATLGLITAFGGGILFIRRRFMN